MDDNMIDLMKLIDARDLVFLNETKSIVKNIPNVVSGILKFLELEDDSASGRIDWFKISKINDPDDEGDIIELSLSAPCRKGELYILDTGETLQVDSEMVSLYQWVISVKIPYTLISSDVDEIYNYLITDDGGAIGVEFTRIPRISTSIVEFDTSELNEDQLESLNNGKYLNSDGVKH